MKNLILSIIDFFSADGYLKKSYRKENENWNGTLPFDIYKFYKNLDMLLKGSGNPFTLSQIQSHELRTTSGKTIKTSMNIWLSSLDEALSFLDMVKNRVAPNSTLTCLVNGRIVIFNKDKEGMLGILFSKLMTLENFVEEDLNSVKEQRKFYDT